MPETTTSPLIMSNYVTCEPSGYIYQLYAQCVIGICPRCLGALARVLTLHGEEARCFSCNFEGPAIPRMYCHGNIFEKSIPKRPENGSKATCPTCGKVATFHKDSIRECSTCKTFYYCSGFSAVLSDLIATAVYCFGCNRVIVTTQEMGCFNCGHGWSDIVRSQIMDYLSRLKEIEYKLGDSDDNKLFVVEWARFRSKIQSMVSLVQKTENITGDIRKDKEKIGCFIDYARNFETYGTQIAGGLKRNLRE